MLKCQQSPDLFISEFSTENINPDKGSIDISDTFGLLHSVKKMWIYLPDIRISVKTVFINGRN